LGLGTYFFNAQSEGVDMLIITNRKVESDQTGGEAFSSKFSKNDTKLSIADAFNASADLEAPIWETHKIEKNASDGQIKKRVTEYAKNAASQGRATLLYVHGNNNDYAKTLARCHFLSQTYEGSEVIGFSWPSEGFPPDAKDQLGSFDREIGNDDGLSNESKYRSWFSDKKTYYLQAKKNAAASAHAFDRCLLLIAEIKNANPNLTFVLGAHSLGNELLFNTIQLKTSNASLSFFSNVLLLAPAVSAKNQALLLDHLNPGKRVFVTYNKNDWILAASAVVDGDAKLGIDPTSASAFSTNKKVRYVDFEGAAGGAGHRYFLEGESFDMKRKKRFKLAKRFFDRTFAGQYDIQKDEGEKAVYLLGCKPNGKVCYMGPATGSTLGDSQGA
jgi:esterase/lipase superfamily enzyme